MGAAETSGAALDDAARALLGRPVDAIEPVGGGANSRVYRVRRGAAIFALKQYPMEAGDPRDRLGTEIAALDFMARNGIGVVPRVVTADCDKGVALLEWIEGTVVDDPSDGDIEQAASFLALLHGLRTAPEARAFGHDPEACRSGSEIERQIRRRLERLQALPAGEGALHAFLDCEFCPALENAVAEARSKLSTAGADFEAELAHGRQSLVPADFGFHNAIRRADGALAFVDFEYFGWDDPVKLAAELLQHPGTALAAGKVGRLAGALRRVYADIAGFDNRLGALYRLFGLRWCLIVLNEFVPERWERRAVAASSESRDAVKTRQLGKARDMLGRLSFCTV